MNKRPLTVIEKSFIFAATIRRILTQNARAHLSVDCWLFGVDDFWFL